MNFAIVGILSRLGDPSSPGLPVGSPSQLAVALAGIVEDSMGGSSGAVSLLGSVFGVIIVYSVLLPA